MAGVEKHEQKPKKAEIIQFPTPPEFAAEQKQAQAEKAAEKLEREQAEQMGREILKAAREAGLTPEEAHAAVNKALTEARERKAAEDARNLELAREVQRKRAEQYLAGKTPEQYFKEMDAAIAKLQGEIGEMAGEWQQDEKGRMRKSLGPRSEHEQRMLAEAQAELLRMQQKRALVEQALKGDQAGFVNEQTLTADVTERPEVMPSEAQMAAAAESLAAKAPAGEAAKVETAPAGEAAKVEAAPAGEAAKVETVTAGEAGAAGAEQLAAEPEPAAAGGEFDLNGFEFVLEPAARTGAKLERHRKEKAEMAAEAGVVEELAKPEGAEAAASAAETAEQDLDKHEQRVEKVTPRVRRKRGLQPLKVRAFAWALSGLMLLSMLSGCSQISKPMGGEVDQQPSIKQEAESDVDPEAAAQQALDEMGVAIDDGTGTAEFENVDELIGLESAGDLGAMVAELAENPEAGLESYDLDAIGDQIYEGFMDREGSVESATGVMANYEDEFMNTDEKSSRNAFGTDKTWIYDLEEDRNQTAVEELLTICRDQPETLAATAAFYPTLMTACGVNADVVAIEDTEARAQALLAQMTEQTDENGGGGELQQRLMAALGVLLVRDTTTYDFYLENGTEKTYYMLMNSEKDGAVPGSIDLRVSTEMRDDSKQLQITLVYPDGTEETGDFNLHCGFQGNLEESGNPRTPVRTPETPEPEPEPTPTPEPEPEPTPTPEPEPEPTPTPEPEPEPTPTPEPEPEPTPTPEPEPEPTPTPEPEPEPEPTPTPEEELAPKNPQPLEDLVENTDLGGEITPTENIEDTGVSQNQMSEDMPTAEESEAIDEGQVTTGTEQEQAGQQAVQEAAEDRREDTSDLNFNQATQAADQILQETQQTQAAPTAPTTETAPSTTTEAPAGGNATQTTNPGATTAMPTF